MGNFFHLEKNEADIDVFLKEIRKMMLEEKTDRIEMSVNCIDGNVSSPSKRSKLFHVTVGFSNDQFDREKKDITMKSIDEIIRSSLICIAIVPKKEPKKEIKTEVKT